MTQAAGVATMPGMDRIRYNVDRLRRRYGWHQQDLADSLQMDSGNLSRALSGRLHSPRISFVFDVAEALGVDVIELFRPIPKKARNAACQK